MPPRAVLAGRSARPPHDSVGRLARFDFDRGEGEPVATVAGVEVLASDGLDGEAVRARLDQRRAKLNSEVERGERKLANEGFVAKAPPEVVADEREKLAAYRAELEELSG